MSTTPHPPPNRPDNTTPSVSEGGLKIWSCVICRRRKVRCDRRDPCANCVKSGIDCHYPVTGRIPRRNRDPAAWKSPAQKQAELLSRLRRLETVVTELAGQVEDGSATCWATPSSSGNGSSANVVELMNAPMVAFHEDPGSAAQTATSGGGSEFDEDFGRLVIDKDGGLHVGNRFWSVFCSEVDNIMQAVHDVTELDGEEHASAALEAGLGSKTTAQSFIFGHRAAHDDLSPLPSQMFFIWQTYVDNVDPFIKILRNQEIEKVVRGLKGKLSSLSPNFEALLFAISMAAIASMDEEDVSLNFGSTKSELLDRFRCGTEQALAKAEFLVTKNMVVIQAFVIYISILSHLGADELAWPLIGLLLRVAKSNRLHIDGGSDSMSETEAELRRRLWWQICFIDSRSRKSGMQDLSSSSFTTRLPRLYLPEHSNPSGVLTSETIPADMTLCLTRCEIWQLVQALFASQSQPLQTRQGIFQEARGRIEFNYLSPLHGNSPYEEFIKTTTSLFLSKVELVINHQSKHCTDPTSDQHTSPQELQSTRTLHLALTIIEAVYELRTEPSWKKWRWQLQGQVPWHAMGIFLRRACHQPWNPTFERAWDLSTKLMDMSSEEIKGGQLWESLDKLMANTGVHREEELMRGTNVAQVSSTIVHPSLAVLYDSLQAPRGLLVASTVIGSNAPASTTFQSRDSSEARGIPSTTIAEDLRGGTGWPDPSLTSVPAGDAMLGLPTEPGQELGQTWPGFESGFPDADAMSWQTWDDVDGVDIVWEMIDF